MISFLRHIFKCFPRNHFHFLVVSQHFRVSTAGTFSVLTAFSIFFPHYPRNASLFFCVSSIFVCGCYATSLTLPVFSAHMPGKRILVPLPVDCILGGLLGVFFSFDSNLSHPHFFIRQQSFPPPQGDFLSEVSRVICSDNESAFNA